MKSALAFFVVLTSILLSPSYSDALVKEPFFYSVKKSDQQWWILGVHHFLPLTELPPVVIEKLREAEFVAIEVTNETAEASAVLYKSTEGDKPISKRAMKALIKRGFSKSVIRNASPSALCEMFYWGPRNLAVKSMDTDLEEQAASLRKKIIGLDVVTSTVKTETTALNACDIEKTIRLNPKKIDRDLEAGFERYRTGDFAKVNEGIDLDSFEIAGRNELWMKKLSSVSTKKLFIKVGVAHLDGPKGLLTLLEKAGFQVRRWSKAP